MSKTRNTSGRDFESRILAIIKNALSLKANYSDIPTVPTMATDPDMEDWTSGKTADAAVLKTLFGLVGTAIGRKANASDIPTDNADLANGAGYQTAQDVQTAINGVRQLPTVSATDNGKFLRVVSGAWAAETVQTWQGGSY